MNLHDFRNVLAAGIAIGLGAGSAAAAEDPAKGASASELASRLSDLRQDGTSSVRLRMEIRGDTKTNLQILIKQRRTKAGSDVVYQVLWPKDRKGEAVLLSKPSSGPTTGAHFVPPNTFNKIEAADANGALFGSDLAYEDVVDNFFGWDQQAIVGKEEVDGVPCVILESKPGKVKSIYGKVKSWIDPRRNVPMRVEKYSTTGQPVRRIDTLRVVPSDGRQIPANMSVRGPGRGGGTILDGSKIRYDVKFSDREFTPEGLKDGASGAAPE